MIKPVFYDRSAKSDIFARPRANDPAVTKAVAEIVEDVRVNGDAALKKYALKFDGAAPAEFEVSRREIDAAFAEVSDDFIALCRRALNNIEAFHRLQVNKGFETKIGGAVLGCRVSPVNVAGIYVPGGTAAYPSTALMNIVPAKVAGVKSVVMTTPPDKAGRIRPEVLVAAALAGADRIFRAGGAQAIAALAFGTESIPKADVIAGPGNIFVATAKKLVYGEVGIDMIAGPSEIMIIADSSADPDCVAADMLAQAEHDRLATAVLVTDCALLAEKTAAALDKRLEKLPRREIAAAALDVCGRIIVVPGLDVAAALADELAPEHLELYVAEPEKLFAKIANAGSVFLGAFTPEAVGDYYAGVNHTLPTGGTARFSSPLGVNTFVKTTQYVRYDRSSLGACAADVVKFAEIEGLAAHGESVCARVKNKCGGNCGS